MQRRTLLGLGLVGGVTLAAFGGAAVSWAGREPAWRDGRLSTTARALMTAVARAVLEGTLPDAAAQQASALSAHLQRLVVALSALAPASQREIDQLLTVLTTAPGRRLIAGLANDWHDADTPQVQQALQSMRTSSLHLKRQAYHALRDLTLGAYFADPSTWAALGYPGPRPLAPPSA